MKLTKYTSALLGLGILSAATAVQAANPVVYLTGASALRTTLYTVLTSSGNSVFDGGNAGTVVSPSPNNTSSSTYIVFEGLIGGQLTDIDIFWTGAEAGVADTAGNIIQQTLTGTTPAPALSGSTGTFNVPGIPGKYLNPYTTPSPWGSTSTLAQIATTAGAPVGSQLISDLGLDDTSQAVSLTPKSLYNLVDYGAVAVVPFTFLKGYESTPDAAWNRVTNVTTAQINQVYAGPIPASFFTGNTADVSDTVVITGRNLSSGTRVNALLTAQRSLTTPVVQWAYQVNYATAGNLNTNTIASYATPGTLYKIKNDGFNSAPAAAAQLSFDTTGQQIVLLEPLAVPDAEGVYSTPPPGGGAPTYLAYNGVYESDSGVEQGTYPFWGYEHIFGTVGQSPSSLAGTVGQGIATSIANYVAANYGNATGAVGPVHTPQSPLIPLASLQVTRSGDSGFPIAP